MHLLWNRAFVETLPPCHSARWRWRRPEATGPARNTFDVSMRTFHVRAERLQDLNLAAQLRRAGRVAAWQSRGLAAGHVARGATASRMAPRMYPGSYNVSRVVSTAFGLLDATLTTMRVQSGTPQFLRRVGRQPRILPFWPGTGVSAFDTVEGRWGSTPHRASLRARRIDFRRCDFCP